MTDRGTLVTHRDNSRRPVYFTVLDSLFDTVVITTHSEHVAKFWKQKIDKCEHQFPYTIWSHYSPKKD